MPIHVSVSQTLKEILDYLENLVGLYWDAQSNSATEQDSSRDAR